MGELGLRIADALANPILDDRRVDPMRELTEVLGARPRPHREEARAACRWRLSA
jgi:hypothetical protein